MGKIWIEVCLISARGLRRTSSFWKLQWFAVGWIDPDNKHCTKIDISGDGNPVWKTKFLMSVDSSKFQKLALNVEVYSREPVFLGSSLLGTATIVLKEFLDKHNADSQVSKRIEEVGSFQLRKKKSGKHQGFVDVSVRIFEEREEHGSSHSDSYKGFNPTDQRGVRIDLASRNQNVGRIKLATRNGSMHSQSQNLQTRRSRQAESSNTMIIPSVYSHNPPDFVSNYPAGDVLNYPPQPPVNAGYVQNIPPRTDYLLPSKYIDMPSSKEPAQGKGSGVGFGMGVSAEALAVGAIIFGDDFLSGFDLPSAFHDFNYG